MAIGTVTRQTSNSMLTTLPGSHGDVKFTVTNVVGAASYTTGGDTITAAQLGLTYVIAGFAQIAASSAGANSTGIAATVLPQSDGSVKLMCFVTASTSPVQVAQAGSGNNLSAVTYQVCVWGF